MTYSYLSPAHNRSTASLFEWTELYLSFWFSSPWIDAGAPRAERGPGASSNMTDLRFCELQNRRRKCCSFVRIMMWSPKEDLHRNSNGFSARNWVISKKNKKHFDGPLSSSWALCWARWSQRPSWSRLGPGVIVPPCPLSVVLDKCYNNNLVWQML